MSELSQAIAQFLSQIQVVMVGTTLPANIGSAARAMHTMGLSKLVVVNPKHPIDNDAIAHAAGATAILDNCKIVTSLDEAIAECQFVMATSSRSRHIPKPVLTPRQAATLMLEYFDKNQANLSQDDANHTNASTALVFGREDRGLTNEELQLADYHIQIPANPNYSVLNVAAAVQVIASVIFDMAEMHFNQASLWHAPIINEGHEIDIVLRQVWDAPAITQAQKQQLEANVLALLSYLHIYHPEQSKVMPQRISRLLGRLQLDTKEWQLLQAAIAKLKTKQ